MLRGFIWQLRSGLCQCATILFAVEVCHCLAALRWRFFLALGIGIRREFRFWTRRTSAAVAPPKIFEHLLKSEQKEILEARGDKNDASSEIIFEAAEEPRASQCNVNFVGLALSGGGIRSATFNLGLLQGLHRFDLLRHVDYLATVSGGGYIGAFWSRWLKESASASIGPPAPNRPQKGLFPDRFKEAMKNFSGDSRVFETHEIRHLREFSNFLFPRVGIFDTETWGGAVALIAAILPAVATALCVLGLSLIIWLTLTFYMSYPDIMTTWAISARAAFLVSLTHLLFLVMEIWWRSAPTGDREFIKDASIFLRSSLALVLVGWLAWNWQTWPALGGSKVWIYSPSFDVWFWRDVGSSYADWWKLLGIVDVSPVSKDGWIWIPRLYEPSLIWLLVGVIFILFRFKGVLTASSTRHRIMLPTNDRVAMRLLGVATLWALFATFWHIGLNMKGLAYVMGGGAAGSAGLFGLLRNWIGKEMTKTRKSSFWEIIKPYVPQVLAYLTIGLTWAALASALIKINVNDWYSWYQACLIMAGPVLFVLLVDPHEFGLHAIYRDRICRAYLGAALPEAPKAEENRQTEFRRADDVDLSCLLPRPLQLICCAANNVGGDHLGTLSRGARSSVLSRYGLAMGNSWVEQPGLTTGSAITASAAAANSNMGSASMQLGPAVSFLMTALNIRLGLWVRHPTSADRDLQGYILPGWRFYKEMGAWTDTTAREIHLSDGAHFDNLGLYELVRRHCRYIIVSDATADHQVAFDDFGRTVRRIREDFGVEIEIDLEPLKPGMDSRAQQHAVVGNIDYGPFDKGILIYLKPSLTGDEPPDISQYKTRNSAFPHEGTGDQFYDEAQWESYRRLGVHTVNKVFDFVEHIPANEQERVQKVFNEARYAWYPTPTGLAERSLQMTARFSHLEQQLKANTVPMLREVFPEIQYAAAPFVGPLQLLSADEELANVSCLLSVMTLMEDVIESCGLQTHWHHPINRGWVNLFARWSTTPTFQRWWPLVKPMYGSALREFLEDRFEILRDAPVFGRALVRRFNPTPNSAEFALEWWQARHGSPPSFTKRTVFEYSVDFLATSSSASFRLQLALVSIELSGSDASWTSDDLFVPFSLWGSPLAHDFLDRLLVELRATGTHTCKVMVKGPSDLDNNQAKWNERQSFVNFYRQAGFRLEGYEPYQNFTSTGGTRNGLWAILALDL